MRGPGPAIVLFHAGISDCKMWDARFAHFAERYRVIRYDSRGIGKTRMPRGRGPCTETYGLSSLT